MVFQRGVWAALGLLQTAASGAQAAAPLAAPGITLSPHTTNRVHRGADTDATLQSLGHTTSVEACGALCVAWVPSSTASYAAAMPAAPSQQQRCHSFTRFADAYADNSTLAGHCFGRLDPSWVPMQAVGSSAADSGTVNWPCADDLDCSLNGKCMHGACTCGKGWRGDRCETLNLAPVDPDVLGFSPTEGGNLHARGLLLPSMIMIQHIAALPAIGCSCGMALHC